MSPRTPAARSGASPRGTNASVARMEGPQLCGPVIRDQRLGFRRGLRGISLRFIRATISGRKSSIAETARSFRSDLDARDECPEGRELLGDDLASGLVLELQRLLVKLRLRQADEDFRHAEHEGVQIRQRHAQVILHACAAEWAAGCRLDRYRRVLG